VFGRKKQPPIKSLIAHGSQMHGNFGFSDGFRLDGSLTGNILGQPDRPSILVISESAVVVGEVCADHLIINGKVDGPVHARVMLELQPKAKITGDVTYKALEMHQGAIVAGMLRPILADQVAQPEEKATLKLAANNP